MMWEGFSPASWMMYSPEVGLDHLDPRGLEGRVQTDLLGHHGLALDDPAHAGAARHRQAVVHGVLRGRGKEHVSAALADAGGEGLQQDVQVFDRLLPDGVGLQPQLRAPRAAGGRPRPSRGRSGPAERRVPCGAPGRRSRDGLLRCIVRCVMSDMAERAKYSGSGSESISDAKRVLPAPDRAPSSSGLPRCARLRMCRSSAPGPAAAAPAMLSRQPVSQPTTVSAPEATILSTLSYTMAPEMSGYLTAKAPPKPQQ